MENKNDRAWWWSWWVQQNNRVGGVCLIRKMQWFCGTSADRKKTKLKRDDTVMGGLFNGLGLHLQNGTERNRHSKKDVKWPQEKDTNQYEWESKQIKKYRFIQKWLLRDIKWPKTNAAWLKIETRKPPWDVKQTKRRLLRDAKWWCRRTQRDTTWKWHKSTIVKYKTAFKEHKETENN